MSAYKLWTLTCDGCGEIFDYGVHHKITSCKRDARAYGWKTGRSQVDDDFCPNCQEDDGGPDD